MLFEPALSRQAIHDTFSEYLCVGTHLSDTKTDYNEFNLAP